MTTPTLRAAFERAERAAWADTAYGPTGIRRGGYVVAYFEEAGKPGLEDIGSAEIDGLRTYLKAKGLKPSTVNQYLSALASLYTHAAQSPELTRYRPAIHFAKIKEKRNRTLSDHEELAMFAYYASDSVMLDIATIALDAGLREGEVLRLTSLDGAALDDAEAAAVIVRTGKSNSSAAAVALTDRAAAVIKRRSAMVGPGQRLFQVSKSTVIRRWNNFRDHMKLGHDTGFTFHCLRHTTCTRVVDSGLDVEAAQRFLRHGHIGTTLKYVKSSARRTRGARDALQRHTAGLHKTL